MLYRASTILAILGYIAAQVVATPHAHSGAHQHPGHCWQPHVHLSGHDATHSHHGHDHHNDAERHDSPNAAGAVIAAEGHDADAVYIPSEIQAISRSEGGSSVQAKWLSLQAALPASLLPTLIG